MSGAIGGSSLVVATPTHVVTGGTEGHALVLDLGSGGYYGMDDVAARIWALLQAPTRVDALRDAIAAEYDVDPAACERDVIGFVEELVARGLAQIRAG